LFTLDGEGIAVEAVKRPESGSGIIVRLGEHLGRSATAVLAPTEKGGIVAATDLLEKPLAEFVPNHSTFRPFQLRTLLVGGGPDH
jgi:alpha-mannosidase